MSRILFGGDMAGTGFGTVTADLGRALIAAGQDVRFVAMNEQPADKLDEPFKGRTANLGDPSGWLAMATDPEKAAALYEKLNGMFGGTLFDDGWTPDASIILGDVGGLQISPILGIVPDGFPAYHYVPIEGVGLPPRWQLVWNRISPVACSRFGAGEISKVTGKPVPVIYHGVDTDTFHPVSAKRPIVLRTKDGIHPLRSREDCRRFLGWPQDATILFRADRLMPRKAYPSLFRALAPVLARHEDVRLIWHARSWDQGGVIEDEVSKYGPILGHTKCPTEAHDLGHPVFGGIAGRMHTTGFHDHFGGVPREVLAAMYNAADIYVSTSAEGFGLTIAESLACGVPAVGLDYSSVPEVIGGAGIVVRVGALVDNVYSHFWAIPDERAFGEAVEALITDKARRMVLGAKGPYQVEQFSWATAAAQFVELIGSRVGQEAAA